jgi:hypothetical protein
MSSPDAPIPTISAHQIAIRLHPADAQDDGLDVTVFTSKLNALVSALSAADKAINGKKVFAYKVAKLQSSSPTALISEVIPKGRQALLQAASPSRELSAMTARAIEGRTPDDARFGPVFRAIARLCSGARKTYEYGELWTSTVDVYRIDGFMEERARRAELGKPVESVAIEGRRYFSGVAIGDFEGVLDYVDLRGSLPAIKLALLIGGGQLDCVCRNVDVEKIRLALKKRAIVTGRAIYDGSGPLPRRVEVADIRLRGPADDFSRWRGSVSSFERVQIGNADDE